MTSNIDYTLSHENYKSILEDKDFDIKKNIDILLSEPNTVNCYQKVPILLKFAEIILFYLKLVVNSFSM